MKRLFVVIAAFASAACGEKRSVTSWNEKSLTVVNGMDSVVMTYPFAKGGTVADSINSAVSRILQSGFSAESEGSSTGMTLAHAVDSLLAEKNADTITLRMQYRIFSEGTHFEKDGIISVYLQAYYFLGGAHGMTMGRYLNFDAKTGRELSVNDMFTDIPALTELSRKGFTKYLAKKGDPENYTPYLFVEPADLPLAQNIGLDKDGVVVVYNQYEIAAYAFGQSSYILPYSEVEHILKKH